MIHPKVFGSVALAAFAVLVIVILRQSAFFGIGGGGVAGTVKLIPWNPDAVAARRRLPGSVDIARIQFCFVGSFA